MNRRYRSLILIPVMALCGGFTVFTVFIWQPDEKQYIIRFDSRKVDGTLGGLKGTIIFDTANPSAAHFDVTVEVETFNSGNKLKNKHAKAKSFLDVKQYPTIRFKTTEVSETPSGYLATGTLQIKEVEKDVQIPFSFVRTENTGFFKGKFAFSLRDFRLYKHGLGDSVNVALNIPVVLSKAKFR